MKLQNKEFQAPNINNKNSPHKYMVHWHINIIHINISVHASVYTYHRAGDYHRGKTLHYPFSLANIIIHELLPCMGMATFTALVKTKYFCNIKCNWADKNFIV